MYSIGLTTMCLHPPALGPVDIYPVALARDPFCRWRIKLSAAMWFIASAISWSQRQNGPRPEKISPNFPISSLRTFALAR